MKIWKLNNTDLATFGLVTALGEAYSLPAKRGDNFTIPYRDGAQEVEQYYDQRTFPIGIAMAYDTGLALETAMLSLQGLLTGRASKTLQQTMESGTVVAASVKVLEKVSFAAGQVVGSGRITIPFRMAEPFFRKTTATTVTATINASPKTFTVAHPGSAPERKCQIRLTGPLSHPIIANTTNGISVQYDDVIGGGQTVVIDCDAMTALLGTNNVVGAVVHTGDVGWMVLDPGNNAMQVTDGTHTSGQVQFVFYAPYF